MKHEESRYRYDRVTGVAERPVAIELDGRSRGTGIVATCHGGTTDRRLRRDRDRYIATAGFVSGGAALDETAVHWERPRSELPTSWRQIRLETVESPRTISLGVEGSF